MDGNRRWAKDKGLASFEGHAAGYQKVKEVAEWVKDAGISHAILYAFSTENWKRKQGEVEYLLSLFSVVIKEFTQEIAEGKHIGTRIRFMGDLSLFSNELQKEIHELETLTEENTARVLAIALSYSGREEILQAARALQVHGGEITEETFSQALWSKDFPDPDLIIRTGGEQRLSNFLPWQSVYSELIFTKTYWPALEHMEFMEMLTEYARRVRNFGV